MLPGLVAAGIVLAAASSAQLPATGQASTEREMAGAASVELPYSRLFSLPSAQSGLQRPDRQLQFQTRPVPRQKVVCGMTLVIVGPEADRAMVREKPREGVAYTMRRYPPPACSQDGEKDGKKKDEK